MLNPLLFGSSTASSMALISATGLTPLKCISRNEWANLLQLRSVGYMRMSLGWIVRHLSITFWGQDTYILGNAELTKTL
jgi:hypothetical protein